MVEKCCNTTVDKTFILGVVYSTNVDFLVLERTHTTLDSFCSRNNCSFVNDNIISWMHLFKGGLHL